MQWETLTQTHLLAQADSLSGGAGWVGAGLLGAVLAWLLLKHIPDQANHTKELVKEFRAEILRERLDCDRRVDALSLKLEGLGQFMRTRAEAVAKKRGITE